MKVQLLNRIIDLDKIYSISPILEPSKEKFRSGEAYENFGGSKSEDYRHRFTIEFLEGKKLLICDWDMPNWSKDKLKNAHEQLIKYWTNNQPEIPKITF